LKTSCWSCFK